METTHTPAQTVATLFFDTHRTYVALVEQTPHALNLSYINATREPLDFFQDADEARNSQGMRELEQLLQDIAGKASSLSVSIDMDSVLAYQLPFSSDFSAAELRQFLWFELQQHSPDADPEDFYTSVHPFQPHAFNHTESALAVFIQPSIMQVAQYAADRTRATLDRVGSAQIDAHNAYAYNYPEHAEQLVAVCGVQSECMDVSIVRGKVFIASASVSMNNSMEIGAACKQTFEQLGAELGKPVESALFFGTDLTKAALDEAARVLPIPSERLNPLRRMKTTLSAREREYCSRVAHVLAPSVGSALPAITQVIRV